MDHFSGMHNWFSCSHARPTYCNVCREALSGVTSHGLSCEGVCALLYYVVILLANVSTGVLHVCFFAVCKFKAHKRCAVRATNNCKWTTLASIGKDIIEDEDGVSESVRINNAENWLISNNHNVCLSVSQISMPHQWLEGNLPVSAKCSVCDKTCGSVLRLQDWRCLWCKAMVSG